MEDSELRWIPARPSRIQEMVETDTRNRIRLILHGACQRPDTRNKVYNKRRMKCLVAWATQRGRHRCSRLGLVRPTDGTQLRRNDRPVRAAPAWDLLYLGPAAKDAVPSLIAALKDDGLFIRLDAAAAFGHIGPEAAPAVPALIQALTNQHRGVRFNSAYSLGFLGPLAKDAVPAFKVALNDSEPEVRTKASEALQKIDPAGFKSAE
jgi:hypothetical protein